METETVSPVQVAQSLASEIQEKRRMRLELEAGKPPWKPRRHYASSLNGCARQLVYAFTAWDQKEPFPADAVAAMQDGNHEEKLLIQELLSDGFDIVEQQVQIDDDRYFVTGRIDGKLRWNGHRVPFEIKRMKPFTFEKVETVEDMKSNPFLLKYLRQLTLYMFLHNEEAGLFILSDGLGSRKVIVVPMDYALAESILIDLDKANAHMKAETLPDRISYSAKVCGYCPFRNVCLSDMNFGGGMVLGETELSKAVARFQEIKPVVAEAERLKKEIKESVQDKPIVSCGDYVVSGEWVERKVKAQEPRTDRYWKWDVEKIGDSNQTAT